MLGGYETWPFSGNSICRYNRFAVCQAISGGWASAANGVDFVEVWLRLRDKLGLKDYEIVNSVYPSEIVFSNQNG